MTSLMKTWRNIRSEPGHKEWRLVVAVGQAERALLSSGTANIHPWQKKETEAALIELRMLREEMAAEFRARDIPVTLTFEIGALTIRRYILFPISLFLGVTPLALAILTEVGFGAFVLELLCFILLWECWFVWHHTDSWLR